MRLSVPTRPFVGRGEGTMTDRSVPSRNPSRNPNRWPVAAGPLRLVLEDVFGPDKVDGWWHPYGTDLSREGSHLINAFPKQRGRIDRIACSPGGWDEEVTFVFTEYGRIPIGTLPAEYRGVALCRLVGGPIIRIQIMRDQFKHPSVR